MVTSVGHFDSANLHELGVYTKVVGYHEGIREALQAELARL